MVKGVWLFPQDEGLSFKNCKSSSLSFESQFHFLLIFTCKCSTNNGGFNVRLSSRKVEGLNSLPNTKQSLLEMFHFWLKLGK